MAFVISGSLPMQLMLKCLHDTSQGQVLAAFSTVLSPLSGMRGAEPSRLRIPTLLPLYFSSLSLPSSEDTPQGCPPGYLVYYYVVSGAEKEGQSTNNDPSLPQSLLPSHTTKPL